MEAEPDIAAQNRLRALRCQKACLVILTVLCVLSLFSGDIFFAFIMFMFVVAMSTSLQQQAQEEMEQQQQQGNVQRGVVRIVSTDPRVAGVSGPIVGAPQSPAPNFMVIQFGNGQTYHVPLVNSAAANLQAPQQQYVETTDLQTGAITNTSATTAIPILMHDPHTSVAGPSGQPDNRPGQPSGPQGTTTWMEDCEAAKLRDGAEDEADALYGSGVAYVARPDGDEAGPREASYVVVHDTQPNSPAPGVHATTTNCTVGRETVEDENNNNDDDDDGPRKPPAKKDEDL